MRLTELQIEIINQLGRRSQSQKELLNKLPVTQSAISRSIKKLKKYSFIVTVESETDGRFVIYKLSETGTKLYTLVYDR